jgi:lipoprotein-anchoring transpeptidase ErfK/SrfK
MVVCEGGPASTGRRMRAARPAVLLALASCLVIGLLACNDGRSPGAGGSRAGSASASAAPAVKEPTIKLSGTSKAVSYRSPVMITVTDGLLSSLKVDTTRGDGELEGDVAADGGSWSSQAPPKPATSYRATAQIKDAAGEVTTKTVAFTVAKVPEDQRLSFTVTPDNGAKVGIGQPIVVRFLTPVSKRAAIEKVMRVDAKTPSGKRVTGSWHWLNSQQIDWRPKAFWTPGTKVTLSMDIAGVKASSVRYGRKDYSETFRIGSSHITKVNASTDRVRVYRDGALVHNWPTGTGRRGLETFSGTYIVLNKSAVVQMDSCSARITCDKKDPDYYDEKEYWATRVTASGTFLHAASWDGLLGQANTSHGCIHLSDSDAKEFYDHAVPGDVVIVSNTGRGPGERIATQDPGLYDWNISWTKWKAGSALS